MFHNSRYLTKGVQAEIPLELQLFMWGCIDSLPQERDYLQVFELNADGNMQKVVHHTEQPEHRQEYLIPSKTPVTEKVYVIDDGEHSTMLLAEEY